MCCAHTAALHGAKESLSKCKCEFPAAIHALCESSECPFKNRFQNKFHGPQNPHYRFPNYPKSKLEAASECISQKRSQSRLHRPPNPPCCLLQPTQNRGRKRPGEPRGIQEHPRAARRLPRGSPEAPQSGQGASRDRPKSPKTRPGDARTPPKSSLASPEMDFGRDFRWEFLTNGCQTNFL